MNLYKFHSHSVIGKSRIDLIVPERAIDRAWAMGSDPSKLDRKLRAQLEKYIGRDAKSAYEYLNKYWRGGRFLAGEKALATEPNYAAIYAAHILHGRWPEAEAVIATDAAAVSYYTSYVIKGRWPPGEDALRTNAGNYSSPYWGWYRTKYLESDPKGSDK